MTQSAADRFQLGAMTIPYARWSFDRALEGIARAGLRHVGISQGSADGPVLPEAATLSDLRAVRQRIERHGLTPSLMFARRPSGDPAESLRRDVDIVAEMGIPFLLQIPVSPSPSFSEKRIGEMVWFQRVEAWFRFLVPAIHRAERRGVTILLKPHGGIAGTGEDLALIVERLGSPAVRVIYDPGNVAYYEGVAPEPDLPNVADLVRAVCIKDHRGGKAVLDFPTPGDGDVDHVSIFRTLAATGFSGPCLIERIDGLQTPEETDRELARGRANLEKAISEIG
ncbi:MAG TPA: sugar phosphate isomerase/epimerase family protein [Chloroflexota bacterium]|nr:sugar phosphate isomerase/epimerase family protein [Chloroflexota bacterium]